MRGLETDGSGSRSPSDGPWLPWMVISLILANAFCYVQGVRPPQNVTFTSENYFVFLTWQPPLDFTSNTQYEIETRSVYGTSGSSNWTKVTSYQENKRRQTLRYELSSPVPYDFYDARVRARDGARLSEWASSNRLQPYKDNIIGPLGLSLAGTDDSLTVVISLPSTPWADDNSSKSFQDIQNVNYQMILLTKEDVEYGRTSFRFTESTFKHTYSNLMHSTRYCVKVNATKWRTKESKQCIRMPGRPADLIVIVMVSIIVIGLILLSIMAGAFCKHRLQRNPSKILVPKSLTFLNPEPNGHPPALRSVLCLEEIASVSAEVPLSETSTALQRIPRGCRAQVRSAYCARGFDAGDWSSDFLSSGVLEYPIGENYRPPAEFTGSSAHSPSSARLLSHDKGTSCSSLTWECEIDNKRRLIRSSSSSRADLPFNSVKLQTMAVISYHPERCLVRSDSDMPQGIPAQQPIEEHHKPHGFPKGSDIQDGSSLELKDMKTITFSGYEFRQPILFCE